MSGESIPLIEERVYIPASIKVELDRMKSEVRLILDKFKLLLMFSGSIFWREFDAVTTSDTPIHSGPCPLEVYQKDEDKQVVGDLVNIGNDTKVLEFRAVTNKTKNLIPLLRAWRPEPEFGEVYPIAAIKYGWGYLIVGGMYLKTENEFKRLAIAIDRFCEWISRVTKF